MNAVFYISAAVAILASMGVVASRHAVHALLYLVVSLLAVATIFYIMGAPFASALEVIVYAGAILVLFVFAVMLLGLTAESMRQERAWLRWKAWPGPLALGFVLAGELVYVLLRGSSPPGVVAAVGARQVSAALFGPYALAVELASLLLLGGLIGAYNLVRPRSDAATEDDDPESARDCGGLDDRPLRETTRLRAPRPVPLQGNGQATLDLQTGERSTSTAVAGACSAHAPPAARGGLT